MIDKRQEIANFSAKVIEAKVAYFACENVCENIKELEKVEEAFRVIEQYSRSLVKKMF